ncbi:YitT family protein [Paenibacillus xylaniclasticus]|uniref:YitT family protein n=1 Tax=Paenibacillus xylaniclasticus TaxID=588083 RepID=UPI000FD8B348|nr:MULTISPECIES: YitT family protein [Paenibacillus]GFN30231.1 membrane protein [Paenibacillus curdlanolyticus]
MAYYARKVSRRFIAIVLTVASAVLVAAGFNQLLIPHQLLSGGVSGISMMIGYLLGGNISLLYFILNVPILIWGWIELGKRFVLLSILSVLVTTITLQFIPVRPLADDILLASVFGGIIVGFGSGLSLRYGGSSGGFDIIASIVSRKRDYPVGMFIFILNGAVIAALAWFTRDPDIALYSLLSIYTAGKVVDLIHVRHVKITAFIVTQKSDQLVKKLLEVKRGITIIRTKGAFTEHEQDMLMTVTTRYELAELRKTILTLDPKAFVNIVETVGVIGQFHKPLP